MIDATINDLIDTIADYEEKLAIEKAKCSYAKRSDSFSVGWIEAMESRIRRMKAAIRYYSFQLALAKSLIYSSGIIPDSNWN
jgi:hypothetical protein